MRHPANALAFFCHAVRAILPFALFRTQLQIGFLGVSLQGLEHFDHQGGSPATKAAENAALMVSEDLQDRPRIALRLFPRYLGTLLARLGKSNRDRLFAARHFAALAAFSRTKRAALLPMHGALHALAGGFP